MIQIKQENPTSQQSPLHIGLHSWVYSRGKSALPSILTSCWEHVPIILILVLFERKAGCTSRREPQHALNSPHFLRFVFISSSIHKQMKFLSQKTKRVLPNLPLYLPAPHKLQIQCPNTSYSCCISFKSVKISV